MSDVLKKLTREMEKVQEPKRFVHTQGVEYTAAALAMRYGEDVERAQVAGLLHDCAKCMGNDKLLSACEKHHIPVTDVERRNPYLLHAKVGSYLAKKEYKVEDPEILSAILYHTTGHPNMTLLEKIIFTADYIEPGRKQAPNLKIIRQGFYRPGCSGKKDPRGHSGLSAIRGWRDGSHDGRDLSIL